MYRPAKVNADAVMVPQLLFSRLAAPGADDGRFRVILYLFGCGGAGADEIARALRLPLAKVEAALHYWEGAGLIEADAPVPAHAPAPEKRKKLTTRESVRAGEADPMLAMLLAELQRVFGAVIGERDINTYVTLYVVDGFAADLVLIAASEAARRGAQSAAYVEKILFSWRREGIDDCAAADAYLKLIAQREVREKELAEKMGLAWDPFTLAEKKKIAQWFEEYGYDWDMIEAARLAAGDKYNDVKYLAGILKKWVAKGYRAPRDVQQGDEGRNLRVVGREKIAPKDDILQNEGLFVPSKRRGRA